MVVWIEKQEDKRQEDDRIGKSFHIVRLLRKPLL
jgi:hypothetical protein